MLLDDLLEATGEQNSEKDQFQGDAEFLYSFAFSPIIKLLHFLSSIISQSVNSYLFRTYTVLRENICDFITHLCDK